MVCQGRAGAEKVDMEEMKWEDVQRSLGDYALIISALREDHQGESWLTGGSVRDLFLGQKVTDLDITVAGSPAEMARRLIRRLGRGSFVHLGQGDESLFRVVVDQIQVDFVPFRGGTDSIEEDLAARDLTINSLAIPVDELYAGGSFSIIAVNSGIDDLQANCIRHCPGAFEADPLRMLRAYRFVATLGFQLDPQTARAVRNSASLITRCAGERIRCELELLLLSPNASSAVGMMGESGLLFCVLPELWQAKDVEQPDFHHLDVYGHSLLALEKAGEIIGTPGDYFSNGKSEIVQYLGKRNNLLAVKWAALLHDIGKPVTKSVHRHDPSRVTFHRHDEEGSQLVHEIGERQRWSNRLLLQTAQLIEMHMHPFHLCNVIRDGGDLSSRAALKLYRRAGENLPGLFLLAMADSLASKGKMKPVRMELEIRKLYDRIIQIRDLRVKPVLAAKPLLTGRDLIAEFDLRPGPVFSEILEELEIARVEGKVIDRLTAVAWVTRYLQKCCVGGRKEPPGVG